MRETTQGKLSAYSVAAGAAAIGIASVAHAQLQAGVVGDGFFMEFGPQDTNGDFHGVRAETMDGYIMEENYPLLGTAPNGNIGAVFMAVDPYTGEVTTTIPEAERLYDRFITTGPSGLPDDPGTLGVDESLVQTETASTIAAPGASAIYFTGESYMNAEGTKQENGLYMNAGANGGMLPMMLGQGDEIRTYGGENYSTQRTDPGTGDPLWLTDQLRDAEGQPVWVQEPEFDELGDPVWAVDELGDPVVDEFGDPVQATVDTTVPVIVNVQDENGDDIPILDWHYTDVDRRWGEPDPTAHDYDGDPLTFADRNLVQSYDGVWVSSGYGLSWSSSGFIGFEMDGYQGWLEVSFYEARNAMLLESMYFDIPLASSRIGDFDGDDNVDLTDIDAMVAAILSGENLAAFDLTGDGLVTKADLDKLILDYVDTSLTVFNELTGEWDFTGTFLADFNLDGQVSILDLGILGDGYNQAGSWATGDANGDGAVDILDLGVLGDNYNLAKPGAGIPEPATMVLLGVGAAGLLARRRRNK